MSELDDLLDPGVRTGSNSNNVVQESVPNANAVLTLGIISIVGCFLYAIPGLICGIIALSMHPKDKAVYLSDPAKYEMSFKNSKAGYVCAIIGVSLSGVYALFVIAMLVGFASAGF